MSVQVSAPVVLHVDTTTPAVSALYAVTMYPRIVPPPVDTGGVHATCAVEMLAGVADTVAGAPGNAPGVALSRVDGPVAPWP